MSGHRFQSSTALQTSLLLFSDPKCKHSRRCLVIQIFRTLTYGSKVSLDSERPQDQPSRDDKQNPPKVAWIILSQRCWKGELIPIYVQGVDQQPNGSQSNLPEPETGSQDDDDVLLEVRISMLPLEDASTGGGDRLNCPRARPPHYSTTMRYVVITPFLPRVNNTL